MRSFLQKIAVFFSIPICLVLVLGIPVFYIAYNSGELLTIDAIIEKQQDENVLVGLAITNVDAILKLKSVKKIRPSIIALGTSRVMQFRKEFFNDDVIFYNAGGATTNLKQYANFIQSLNADEQPAYVIVGLDQYFFCQNYAQQDQSVSNFTYNHNSLQIIVLILKKIIYREMKLFPEYNFRNNIGLTAKIHGDGFRKDGSYQYNRILNDQAYGKQYKFPFDDTTRRIEVGIHRFEYGDKPWNESVKQVIDLLEICKNRGICLIGFLPPYAPYIYDKMLDTGKYDYLNQIYPEILPIFNKYGYELYDFSDVKYFADDSVFIDGFHGSDIVYHKIILEMKNQNSKISQFVY
jgi:hypothetical protein